MTKSNHTKRALLASVLSMALCLTMLVGSTFAWFTDSVTSGRNQILAGNLDVELYHTNTTGNTEKVSIDTKLFLDAEGNALQWEPGVMVYENFTVKNVGSLALKYQLTLNAKCNTVAGVSLADVLRVAVLNKAFDGDRAAAQAQDFSMTVAEFVKSGAVAVSGALEAGKTDTPKAVIIYWQPSDKDNDYNFNNDRSGLEPLSIDLGVSLVATQDTVESDSFGKDYDADLAYPELPTVIDATVKENVEAEAPTVLKNETAGVTATIPVGALDETVTQVTLQVETKETTVNSATYEISLIDQDGNAVKGSKQITVELAIGKGFKNVTVNHNNKPMAADDYAYNPATGVVTIRTDSFSPFTVMFEHAEGWDGSADSEGLAQNTNVAEKTVNIATPEQLAAFAQDVNSGKTYEGYTIKLMADINLNNIPWTPIGDFLSSACFNGNFDGQGHTIKNLTCDSYMAGLFGQSEWKPEGRQSIKNFTVENAKIIASNKHGQAGFCAAVVYGSAGPQTDFEDITVKGDIIVTAEVEAYYMAAIVAGRSWYGAMNNCHVYANEGSYVECKGVNYINYTAGLAAWHGEGTKVAIQNSSSNIDVRGVYATAGLLGIAQYGNTVKNCTVGLNEDGTMRRVNISRGISSGDNQDANDIGGIVGMITDDQAQNVCVIGCTGMVHFDVDFGNVNHDGVIGNNYKGNDSTIIVVEDCHVDWTKK